MTKLFFLVAASLCIAVGASEGHWDRIGPHNIFNGKENEGEAGTLCCAASPAAHPDIIYAGGHNNGASSGILKTVDGGIHWTRNSNGMWDTKITAVWIHPDDTSGNRVFAGTPTGVYESTDGAVSWTRYEETLSWGVNGFHAALINNEKYIIADTSKGILTMPQAGGNWTLIPGPTGEYTSSPYSVVTEGGKTTVYTCTGSYYGGKLFYFDFASATAGTWSGPQGGIKCADVGVDPNDRNHIIFTDVKDGKYAAYESNDAGKTSHALPGDPTYSFYVHIDHNGYFYKDSQGGAYISRDGGKTWTVYHVIVHTRGGKVVDRTFHDFQGIVEIRDGQVAFPSDQGLHIVNGNSPNLTSAVGDMRNSLIGGLAVSPGDQDGPRKLVVTMWDWSASASWDDGATWASWEDTFEPDIQAPAVGEGGGTMNLGKSGHALMWHHSTNWYSNNGGKNFTKSVVELGSLEHSHDYLRLQGSRSEPSGTVFTLANVAVSKEGETEGSPDSMDTPDSMDPTESMEDSEEEKASSGTSKKNVLVSEDFGVTWTGKPLPDSLQTIRQVVVNPDDAAVLFAVTPNCLTKSTNKGSTWGSCSYTPTQGSPAFTALTVISSNVMFLLRGGSVPLRTTDGGKTWTELTSAAPLFKYGATLELTTSWSGKTLVFHGNDHSAIQRGEYGTKVWKSINNGDDWSDETGDMITISLGHGVWYENDFYLVSYGEGVMVKRNFGA